MKTLAAILFELNSPLWLEKVEIPALRRGQVLAKILYSGICRAQYNEMIGLKGPDPFLPHLLGHEAAGIVADTGPGITKVKDGDYVALSWIKSDGREVPSTRYSFNGQVVNAGAVTTFSQYSVVSENRVTKISRRMPADAAAIVGCAVVTGAGIIDHTLKAEPGSSLAVFGIGGIGTSVIMAARLKKLRPIIAVDVVKAKLAFAKRFGATHVVDASAGDPVAAIRKIAPAGVDYAVDASGVKSAMEAGFAVIKTTGILVIAGNLAKDERISLHPFELIKGKGIVGTWGGEAHPARDIPRHVRAYLDGKMPLDKLITHRIKLADINDGFALLKTGQAGRIVVEMPPGDD